MRVKTNPLKERIERARRGYNRSKAYSVLLNKLIREGITKQDVIGVPTGKLGFGHISKRGLNYEIHSRDKESLIRDLPYY